MPRGGGPQDHANGVRARFGGRGTSRRRTSEFSRDGQPRMRSPVALIGLEDVSSKRSCPTETRSDRGGEGFTSPERNAGRGSDDANRRGRIFQQLRRGTDGAPNQLAPAVRTHESQLFFRAVHAIGALEAADEGVPRIGRKIAIAAFTIWAEFQRHKKQRYSPPSTTMSPSRAPARTLSQSITPASGQGMSH